MPERGSNAGWRPEWFDLFRCFRMACDPAKVWLGFLGAAFSILMLVLSLALLLNVRQHTGGEVSQRILQHVRSGNAAASWAELRAGMSSAWTELRRDGANIRASLWNGRLLEAVQRATTLRMVVSSGLVLLLLLWLPWAYFGGAISRSAVVEYATGRRITTAEARQFAAARYSSFFWPPVASILVLAGLFLCGLLLALAAAHILSAVVLFAGVFGSCYALVVVKQKTDTVKYGGLVALIGLAVSIVLARLLWNVRPEPLVWIGQIFVVLSFPLLLLLAAAAIYVCFVFLFGRGLMTSCVSYQGTDAFDAIVRAGDYLFRRPWHFAFYTLVSAAYGLPCLVVVALFVLGGFTVASLMAWSGFGAGFARVYSAVFAPEASDTLFGPVPGFLLRVVFALLCGLVVGWCASFAQSARAVCYALLRRQVDGAAPAEVYLATNSATTPLKHQSGEATPSQVSQ